MKPRIQDKKVIFWRPRKLGFLISPEVAYLKEQLPTQWPIAVIMFDHLLDVAAANYGKAQKNPGVPFTPFILADTLGLATDEGIAIAAATLKALKKLQTIVTDKRGVINFVNELQWFGKAFADRQFKDNRAAYMKAYRSNPEKKEAIKASRLHKKIIQEMIDDSDSLDDIEY